jgi:nitrite reductase/ring-hydroxylating ferredoxin subunit
MMLLQNSYISTLCQYVMGLVCCEADYKLFQLVAQDLARHRAYAMEHLRYVLLRANRRRGELLAYLNKGEQFLVRDENLNKALPAAFAILAGGNIENIAEGMALYEQMRSEATERYVRMLEWAGLREKREQLNPTMASWLPKPAGATYEVEVEAIKPGGLHLGKAEGVPILIAEVEGQYYALNNRCTHQGCPLSGGSLEGPILQCRCHGSRFDVRTGQVVGGPAERPVETYAVRVENGKVIVTL